MRKEQIYNRYPIWIVLIVNILMILVYISGAYILLKLSLIMGTLYIIYLIILEFQTYRGGCRNCCYFGGVCAFGKGMIAKIFFKKGDSKAFDREIGWKDLLPQVLVFAIPLIVGIALIISRGFDLLILLALIYPVLSWFLLNPIIYSKLSCPHCKQGSICCPALKLFNKNGGKK